jgi:hypothetical protein
VALQVQKEDTNKKFELELTLKTAVNQHNFSSAPVDSTNLETMPVPGSVQGQNPTQGQ